jgi:muramidase (phage lysozyme)
MSNEGKWDSSTYSQKMKEDKNELTDLQTHLNELMVHFVMRTLRVYQSTRPEPLRPGEIALLVKNELNNVVYDLSQPANLEALAKMAKEEWAKQTQQ